jgi:hypothetical protein
MSSSALLFGLFELIEGFRVSGSREVDGRTVTTHHCVYQTWISCDTNTFLDAELRVYSPGTNPIVYPDHTIAIIYGKFSAPANQKILIEAIRMIPFPGDPSVAETYLSFPPGSFTTILTYGAIQGPHTSPDPGTDRHFLMNVSDYVRDEMQQSQIE